MGHKEKLFPCEDSPAVEQGPRGVVSSPTLEVFKTQLTRGLSNLVEAKLLLL